MYVGTTIFSQLMQYLPWHRFYPIVRRYESNHNIRFISTYLLIAIIRKRHSESTFLTTLFYRF